MLIMGGGLIAVLAGMWMKVEVEDRASVSRHGGMVFWKFRVFGVWSIGGTLYLTQK